MLSLNEIRNVHFRKSNFNGYKSEDVEAFVDEVQESYDQLLRENAELQKKVDVLAGRLDDYQHEEDGIRSALINAQKLGDASLRDAKHKAEIILKDATIKAEKIVANAQIEIKREKEIVERMQKDVADFKTNLLKLYKEHLMLINNIRSEDVLRPQTREYANAVHIIDTPFADERYAAPQPNVQDFTQQAAPDVFMPQQEQPQGFMPAQDGSMGMPYGQPADGSMSMGQPADVPYGAAPDFQPVPFEMPIKKEPSLRPQEQNFSIPTDAPAEELFFNPGVDFTPMDSSAPTGQELNGAGFSVNIPDAQRPFDDSQPIMESTPAQTEQPQQGLFKKKRRG